jgi:hypothetical protein
MRGRWFRLVILGSLALTGAAPLIAPALAK